MTLLLLSLGFSSVAASECETASFLQHQGQVQGTHYGYAFSLLSRAQNPPILLDRPSSQPYNFAKAVPEMKYSLAAEDEILFPILSQVKDGFFVESGAHDGEFMSNTVFYEAKGWQGLLVEPGPAYDLIAAKHRKAWVFKGALSPSGHSETLGFKLEAVDGWHHLDKSGSLQVRAEPLEKIMAALDPPRRRVDFWSLDIEGSECQVLQATDFTKLQVGVVLVEMDKSEKANSCIRETLTHNGFRDLGRIAPKGRVLDGVFLNKAYEKEQGLSIPEKVPGIEAEVI